MLKIFFYISIAIAIIALISILYFNSNYFNRTHNTLLAGFDQTLIALAIMVVLIIWWIIYFSITKDFTYIWIPITILLIIATPFLFDISKNRIEKHKQDKERTAWIDKSKNLRYVSNNLGISFQYISESQYDGAITITEIDDVIRLNLEKKPEGAGALKVFEKENNESLIDYLNTKHNIAYPKCRFYELEKYNSRPNFPDNYSVVGMIDDDYSIKGCPLFGIEYPKTFAGKDEYFVMDKEHPTKYIFLSVSRNIFEAHKPTDERDYLNWYETIIFE